MPRSAKLVAMVLATFAGIALLKSAACYLAGSAAMCLLGAQLGSAEFAAIGLVLLLAAILVVPLTADAFNALRRRSSHADARIGDDVPSGRR